MTETDKTEKLEAQEEIESNEGNEESKTVEKSESKSNKKIIGIIIVAIVVIALICGGIYMATSSGQEQLQEEVVEAVVEEVDPEAHVILEAELGEFEILTDASFAIYEKDNEKTFVLKGTDVAINEHIEINANKLKEGEAYKLYLTETPILSDGSLLVIEKVVEFTFEEKEHFDIKVKLTRIAPEKMSKTQLEETATALEAIGETELTEGLRALIEAAPEESEVATASSSEGTSTSATSNSGGGSSGSNNGSGSSSSNGGGFANSGQNDGQSNPNEGKTWHEAITEWGVVKPGGSYQEPYTVYFDQCYCGADLTGIGWAEHAKANGGIQNGHHGFWGDVPRTEYRTVTYPDEYGWIVVREAGWY